MRSDSNMQSFHCLQDLQEREKRKGMEKVHKIDALCFTYTMIAVAQDQVRVSYITSSSPFTGELNSWCLRRSLSCQLQEVAYGAQCLQLPPCC